MLCGRCNRREGDSNYESLCSICVMEVMRANLSKSPALTLALTDDEVIKNHLIRILMDGCRECGDKHFGFEVGVQEEEQLKWYVANIQCGNCHSSYREIMEVRMNEPNTDGE